MRIVNVDNNIIKELRKCDISTKMRSLESCEWVVLEEIDGIIIGAAGLGGLFHVSGIQISEIHAGKGIGKRLQNELINESKRRGYSFILVFNDPRNIHSERLHNSLGYERIFRTTRNIISSAWLHKLYSQSDFSYCIRRVFLYFNFT